MELDYLMKGISGLDKVMSQPLEEKGLERAFQRVEE